MKKTNLSLSTLALFLWEHTWTDERATARPQLHCWNSGQGNWLLWGASGSICTVHWVAKFKPVSSSWGKKQNCVSGLNNLIKWKYFSVGRGLQILCLSAQPKNKIFLTRSKNTMTSKTFLLRWQIAFGLSFNFHNTCKVWTLVGTTVILSTSNLTLSWVKRTPSRYRINGSIFLFLLKFLLLIPDHRSSPWLSLTTKPQNCCFFFYHIQVSGPKPSTSLFYTSCFQALVNNQAKEQTNIFL